MFWNIAAFEVRYHLRQATFWVTSILFFLLTFLAVTNEHVNIGSGGNVKINSPYAIMETIMVMSVFGIFITTALVANSVIRDFEHKVDGLIFSSRISKFQYLYGRFLGSYTVAVLAFSSVALAMMIGVLMPWLDPEQVMPFHFSYYVFSMVILALPNLLITAALFFALATMTRSLMATYLGVVAFFVLYFTSQSWLDDPQYLLWSAMADPFGFSAFEEQTRYWTAFERNTQLLSLDGLFLANRILWITLAIILLAVNFRIFRFGEAAKLFSKKQKSLGEEVTDAPLQVHLPRLKPLFDFTTPWRQLWLRTRFEIKSVVKSLPFGIILLLGVFNVFGGLVNSDAIYGTDVYPVTRIMVEMIQGAFNFILMIILIYYSAELVWRERQAGTHEIIDATPVKNNVLVVSKFIAMIVVLLSLLLIASVTTIATQLGKGYSNLELGLYLKGAFLQNAIPFYLIAMLALFVQVVSKNKFIGMLIMVLYLISTMVLDSLGFEHNLYQFAGRPPAPYSDMNRFGHFIQGSTWYAVYWSLFALLLGVAAYLFWPRGATHGGKARLLLAKNAITLKIAVLISVLLISIGGSGAYIFYNTVVLNEYLPSTDVEILQADYEKKYAPIRELPIPRITDIKVDVDIYPHRQAFEARGRYRLNNKTDQLIDRLYVSMPENITLRALTLEGAVLQETDKQFLYHIYKFEQPMQPGDIRDMDFEVALQHVGFRNDQAPTLVVDNGSFFNNYQSLPRFGFQEDYRLKDRNKRRKHGLPALDRMADIDDEAEHQNSYLSTISDWVNFETTVSTSKEQIAIAPGYLQREWIEGERRYFHYKMDAPIHNFFAYLSADYSIKKDQWNDVAIEIYYHHAHDFNLERMTQSVKDSLDYFSAAFGPYQHRQMRIIEFPAYARFAQSFPNTVPYSEGIGFIADLSDEEAIDYVYYVTAHEVAHQWWAHQVLGANVKGATVMSETLSQYSALMVMKREYGEEKIRRFLKYELDKYLRGRTGERIEEMPLMLTENQQYIHYQKGSLVMYALQDYLGEAKVNRALKNFVDEFAFTGPPYPTTRDLLRYIRAEANERQLGIIDDLFAKIILYDLKVTDAEFQKTEEGRFKVNMTVAANKYEADGKGKESEVIFDDLIDIGIFSENPSQAKGVEHVLYFAKHRINEKQLALEFTVDQEPLFVGIDPYHKLVDRNPNDNQKKISQAE